VSASVTATLLKSFDPTTVLALNQCGTSCSGLGLFSVTGASIALTYRLGPAEALVPGAISGIGAGILRLAGIRDDLNLPPREPV